MNLRIVNFYPELSGDILSKEIRTGLERDIERIIPVDFRFEIRDMFVEKQSFISPVYLNEREQKAFLEVVSDILKEHYEDKVITAITRTDQEAVNTDLKVEKLEEIDEIEDDVLILMPDVRVSDIKDKVTEREDLIIYSLETDPLIDVRESSQSYLTGDFYFKDLTLDDFYLTERYLREAVYLSRADIDAFYTKFREGEFDIYLLREIRESLNRVTQIFFDELEEAEEWEISKEGYIKLKGEPDLDKIIAPIDHAVFILDLLLEIYRNLTREEKLEIEESRILFYLVLSIYLKDSKDDIYFKEENSHFFDSFLKNLESLREAKRRDEEGLLKLLRRRIITPEIDKIYKALFENKEVLERLRSEESYDEFVFIFNSEVILPNSFDFSVILSTPKRLKKLTELLFEYREELVYGSNEDGENQGNS